MAVVVGAVVVTVAGAVSGGSSGRPSGWETFAIVRRTSVRTVRDQASVRGATAAVRGLGGTLAGNGSFFTGS
ncbi:hypothetical protein Sliba_52940 [Streptomyces nigrescens]|uniref:Uncharacterized protein n=1 Tax=Streptomyces nigrescens TaxID=1920 RepID=A0A640TRG4_STRNI|nr:hypothetical protein Sliba_52940 [Streptomyces libani subsp. libani]GGV95453.1 hypothetical protein GCM10010500_35870 [Streptomyces libani subsp. libani]